MPETFGTDSSGIATAFLVRALVYAVFMSLGVALVRVPPPGRQPAGPQPKQQTRALITTKPLFVVCAPVILSFYGGGFATVPAYLKDLFGTYQVGAIHGRLLTAWSTAGVLGPLIVNWVADTRESAGRTGPSLSAASLYIMIGLLAVGFVANELVCPVHPPFHEPQHQES